MAKKYIFTSKGLTTEIGKTLIGKQIIEEGNVEERKIALFYQPYDHIRNQLIKTCLELGFRKENIYLPEMDFNEMVDFIYVTEGNSFEIISNLRSTGAVEYIRQVCASPHAVYIGASAGALISSSSLQEALDFDRNHEGIDNFTGLNLHSSLILPHYNRRDRAKYIRNSAGILQKYTHIYNVSDTNILVLCEKDLN